MQDGDILRLEYRQPKTYKELAMEVQAHYMHNHSALSQLMSNNPTLAEAVLAEDPIMLE